MTEAFISFNYFRLAQLSHLRFAKDWLLFAKTPLFAKVSRAQPCDCMQRTGPIEIATDCYEHVAASRMRRCLDGSYGIRDGG